MSLPLFFFWVFAAVTVAGALGVVLMRQPLHSALFLLLSFLGVAALYLLARAELVAAVQILVYAGGIMVLFLYTIMLVNVKRTRTERFLTKNVAAALVVGVALLGIVGGTLLADLKLAGPPADGAGLATTVIGTETVLGNTEAVGWLLYRDYFLPFEIASVFLLVAMIGAVVLGKRTMESFD